MTHIEIETKETAFIVKNRTTGEILGHFPFLVDNQNSRQYAFDHALTCQIMAVR